MHLLKKKSAENLIFATERHKMSKSALNIILVHKPNKTIKQVQDRKEMIHQRKKEKKIDSVWIGQAADKQD